MAGLWNADSLLLGRWQWVRVEGSGGALFPQTGYFEKCPFLTIDVDIEGRILEVDFALDAKNGRLENDVECSINRHSEDDVMVWTITLPQGITLACDEEETWRAVGKLADTLSVTLTPRNEMLTLAIKSGLSNAKGGRQMVCV